MYNLTGIVNAAATELSEQPHVTSLAGERDIGHRG